MENKGLEALAALASAAPAPTSGTTGNPSQPNNENHPGKGNPGEKPVAATGDTAAPSTVSHSQNAVTPSLPTMNASGGVNQNNNNNNTANVQWPQQSNLLLTPANLALLARLQQQQQHQQQPTDNSSNNNMTAMQQQLSYLNLLVQQAQAQNQRPQNPIAQLGAGLAAGNQQALQLLLAGNPAAVAALFQKPGTCLIVSCCCCCCCCCMYRREGERQGHQTSPASCIACQGVVADEVSTRCSHVVKLPHGFQRIRRGSTKVQLCDFFG